MKKTMIFICLAVILAAGAMAECDDSAKEFDVFAPGVVSFNNLTFADSCVDGSVIENFCLNGTLMFMFGACPFACADNYTCADCVPEGLNWTNQEMDENLSFFCCEGLIQVENSAPDAGGACVPAVNQSFTCAQCGNGICGLGENRCNCPADCVSAQPQPSGGGGGGGGGGAPAPAAAPLVFNAESITSGYEKELKAGDKIKFNTEDRQNHTLALDSISGNYVKITITSTPIGLTLFSGQEVKLNLTSKDYYDLLVRVESISGANANITIKSIHEIIAEPAVEVTGEKNETKAVEQEMPAKTRQNRIIGIVVSVLVLVLVAVGIVALVLLLKRRKRSSK
jgi:hypothetical protein